MLILVLIINNNLIDLIIGIIDFNLDILILLIKHRIIHDENLIQNIILILIKYSTIYIGLIIITYFDILYTNIMLIMIIKQRNNLGLNKEIKQVISSFC